MKARYTRALLCLAVVVSALAATGCPSSNAPSVAMTPVTITALERVNGALVPNGFSIAAKNSSGEVTQFTAGSNPCTILVEANDTYEFTVTSSGLAQDKHDSVKVAGAAVSGTYICQPITDTSVSVEAPSISSFAYTTAADPTSSAAAYTEISEGSSIDISGITGVRLITTSKTAVRDTYLAVMAAGPFASIGLDSPVTSDNRVVVSSSSFSYDDSSGYFTTTMYFTSAFGSVLSGSHTLNAVAYDVASNRVERDVAVIDSVACSSGADISADSFKQLYAGFVTVGVSGGYYSTQSKSAAAPKGLNQSSSGANYSASVAFGFVDSNSADVALLGFKVYRSSDGGSTWTLVGTKNYGTATAKATHSYNDSDSSLQEGVGYMYKVVAFTDDSHIKESAPTPEAALMPAFTSSLVSPADKSTGFDCAADNFVYSISNTALWNPAVSRTYDFSLYIRSLTGMPVYLGVFEYNFDSGTLYYMDENLAYVAVTDIQLSEADCFAFDSSTGRITLKPALLCKTVNLIGDVSLDSNATYAWNIFGYWNFIGGLGSSQGMIPQFFFMKYSDISNGTSAFVESDADSYMYGNDTVNGYFTFTAK